jgi:hypothetical protein
MGIKWGALAEKKPADSSESDTLSARNCGSLKDITKTPYNINNQTYNVINAIDIANSPLIIFLTPIPNHKAVPLFLPVFKATPPLSQPTNPKTPKYRTSTNDITNTLPLTNN